MGRAMFSDLSKAITQCSDPAFRGVLLRALAASTALFVLTWIAAWLLLSWTGAALNDWLAGQDVSGFWVEVLRWLFGALSLAGVLFASFLLFPGATALILSFLLDDIAEAVERRHYPELASARHQPLMEAIGGALSFAGMMILLNLIALPFYLLLSFLPPFNLFVFYGLNGYLLGREYFELVAARRLGPAAARRLRKRYRGRVFMAGMIIAFVLTLPVINLVTPIVATAFMLHVFQELRRRGSVPETASG